MNAESARIQALEDERRQNFIAKTEAEITAERFQRRFKQAEIQIQDLQKSIADVSCGKSEAELKTLKLQHRVEDLEADLRELQSSSMTKNDQSGIPAVEAFSYPTGATEVLQQSMGHIPDTSVSSPQSKVSSLCTLSPTLPHFPFLSFFLILKRKEMNSSRQSMVCWKLLL
ncbi:hypothetical protein C8R42DRAFT_246156 [Lentinula raphanica]|nr:hypothetical protein C8R42DRAFT_246156 [Lentinula raphanica]